MKRYLILLLLVLIGCGPDEPPKSIRPKDDVRVKEGATDADAPKEFTTTDSGLKYRILRKTDGTKPTEKSKVRVHYRGTFDDGKIFDSTYGTYGQSATFAVTQVIKGWTEGLQLTGEGGMIELEVPPELAYGTDGGPMANKTLHFIVEIIEVK